MAQKLSSMTLFEGKAVMMDGLLYFSVLLVICRLKKPRLAARIDRTVIKMSCLSGI